MFDYGLCIFHLNLFSFTCECNQPPLMSCNDLLLKKEKIDANASIKSHAPTFEFEKAAKLAQNPSLKTDFYCQILSGCS